MAAARKKHTRRTSGRKTAGARKSKTTHYWSARVMRESDALDLKEGVFKQRDPKKIAVSLKRSAERSHRRKAEPYRSALSMLTFYINRAGRKLPASRKRTLNKAKSELKVLFGKD